MARQTHKDMFMSKHISTAQAAADQVTEYVRRFTREYNVMAKDPLFSLYGGVASDSGRTAYVARRLQEIRSGLTEYLHRPEFAALAESLDDVLNCNYHRG